ncbi:MAG: class I SAM-dependent methyltransferase [Candidatus Rokubacteria bacterium]|nr:class I SAM-dependent methyltransferase [Candidatus Rokubacteria bacterium]
MVATARRLNPKLEFSQGDFFALDLAEGALAGVAAFYSLIHCARGELPRAAREIFRVLQPGGRLLMTVHAGAGEVGRDEAFGKRVALVATLFSESEVRAAVEGAGFRIDEMVTRPPYDFEYQSQRIYTVAAKP